ncbi:echinoderm microtubule-associated protein-like CG42247 [Caerostris extrusa]|uniref:Echinoderm microtubule-associated protein-like CG42247 n=1 Tax=Caerostris extrusa TaxID=172846 RepID=A0AAV4XQP1_CAEEX|nr:echinoderm microtubule-associated protein-like CG42247 [Caerostris extrusa]
MSGKLMYPNYPISKQNTLLQSFLISSSEIEPSYSCSLSNVYLCATNNVKDDLISQETTTQVLETIRSSPIAQTKYPAPRKPIRTSKGQANPDRKRNSQAKNGKKSTRRCTSENSEQRSS